MRNLYHIENKDGQVVRFIPNEQQEEFLDQFHGRDVILKARQLGFSTLVALLMLDGCVFNSNTHCGIIDATLDDAVGKLRKVRFAYDRMPLALRKRRPLIAANASKLEWSNASSVQAGTSHRGGTLQILHISELGKIAAKYPEKAKEIRTGALNTVTAGQHVIIESTAEGQAGDFYEACQIAESKYRLGVTLTPLDFRFHFSPWWKAREYTLAYDVAIPLEFERYFAKLAKNHGIHLTTGQKAWYVKMAETQRDEMKREYPSTSAEAFEAAVEGAIFGAEMEMVEREQRIGKFPAYPDVPVHSFWDIGRRDYNAIWFAQAFAGKVRCVGYFQDMMAGLPHYTEYCFGTAHAKKVHKGFFSRSGEDGPIQGIYERMGWKVGKAVFPHDIAVEEWGSQRTRIEQAVAAGFDAKPATVMSLHDGINAARATLGVTEFDADGCGTSLVQSKRKGSGSNNGVGVLKAYRWAWDEKSSRFVTGTEDHDNNSHGAGAFRYLSTSWRELPPVLEPKKTTTSGPLHAIADRTTGAIKSSLTFDQIVRQKRLAAKVRE